MIFSRKLLTAAATFSLYLTTATQALADSPGIHPGGTTSPNSTTTSSTTDEQTIFYVQEEYLVQTVINKRKQLLISNWHYFHLFADSWSFGGDYFPHLGRNQLDHIRW